MQLLNKTAIVTGGDAELDARFVLLSHVQVQIFWLPILILWLLQRLLKRLPI